MKWVSFFFFHILVCMFSWFTSRDDTFSRYSYLAYPYMSGKRGSLLLPASL
jgi:hypothetical protein